jgi:hypothetical protein
MLGVIMQSVVASLNYDFDSKKKWGSKFDLDKQ